MGLLRFELKSITPEAPRSVDITPVDEHQLDEYISLRDIEGICDEWVYQTRAILEKYLGYVNNKIDKTKTLKYLQHLKNNLSVSTYRKRTYAIRKFLYFLNVEWAKNIKPPSEPDYSPKHISLDRIKSTFEYFKGNEHELQAQALIHLGMDSGARAEELYQLLMEDIDMSKNIVYINHKPKLGQTTKTKKSRISFFTDSTKKILEEYFSFYDDGCPYKHIFGQSHIMRLFRKAPIHVKDLRKYFSQEWTRRNGNSSVKKILMGHSLKGDVDLGHYNVQSTEELKQIYDSVMLK